MRGTTSRARLTSPTKLIVIVDPGTEGGRGGIGASAAPGGTTAVAGVAVALGTAVAEAVALAACVAVAASRVDVAVGSASSPPHANASIIAVNAISVLPTRDLAPNTIKNLCALCVSAVNLRRTSPHAPR
jgi:hypothetical protein